MGKKALPRQLEDSEAMAYAKNIRCSPQKLNLLAQIIRGKKCEEALSVLRFSKKRVAGSVAKLLQSAIANAENNHQLDVDHLVIAEATVGKTLVMKRLRTRARGRGARIEKPYSNMRLIVRESKESA